MSHDPERRLLLIEDDADLREVLAEMLETAGFAVVTADGLDAGKGALERSGYDLVLSDFRTGGNAIDESWQQLAALQRLAGPVPIGLLTAWNLTAAEVADRGFAFLLSKPFELEALLDQVGAQLPSQPLRQVHAHAIRAYFAGLERGAWDRVAALCSDDVVYELPGDHPRFGRTVTGRAAFAQLAAQTFSDFAEPSFEVESIRALPRGALARYRSRWRTAAGAEARGDGFVLFQFRDDEIARIGVRTDVRALSAAS